MIGGESATATGEAQGIVTCTADPVLGMPVATALDAKPRTQQVMDCVAKKFLCRRWLYVRFFHRVPAKQFELWSHGAKLGCRCEGKVKLQAPGEQEHPVNGSSAWQIKKLNCIELLDDGERPVFKHIKNGKTVGNSKGEVQIGPSISIVQSEGAHEST